MASVRWLLPVAVVAAGCGDAAGDSAVLPGLDGSEVDVALTAPPVPTTLPEAEMADGDDIAAPDGGSVESTTVVGPAVTTVAPTTVVTVPAESGEPAEEPEPDVFVRRGDTGPDVVSLQQRLIAVGYLEAAGETGVFDDATADALIDFQAQYGLVVDGIFGPESDRALNAAVASSES